MLHLFLVSSMRLPYWEGPSVSVVGDAYRIVIGSEQTNGVYALIDMLIPPKGGPGPHSHANFQKESKTSASITPGRCSILGT
jgi:hypothetical protein